MKIKNNGLFFGKWPSYKWEATVFCRVAQFWPPHRPLIPDNERLVGHYPLLKSQGHEPIILV